MTVPAPLSAAQKRLLVVLTLLIAVSRLFAIAASLNDWDEALFSLAVEEYEVPRHQPHPPGYPLFIAAAKIVHLFGVPEFRSLQTIVVLGAILIFPACFAFARELGLSFRAAVAGAAIFSFLPNVWVYGGTGFSDVPSVATVFIACALLLRGRTDRRAYVLGAVVLGIAAGMRPTNLLVGAVPAVIATIAQFRVRAYGAVATAFVLGAIVAGGSYAGAAAASSSVENFIGIVETQSDYVRRVDSWRNPNRTPLPQAARVFFLHPFGKKSLGNALAIAAVAGLAGALLRRKAWALILLAMYVPTAAVSWLNFDIGTVSRYAINYAALHALFAACGLFVVGDLLARRSPRSGTTIGAILTAALMGSMIAWTFEAIVLQRSQASPVASALEWVRSNTPESAPLHIHASITPHATFLLRGRRWMAFENAGEVAATGAPGWRVQPEPGPAVKQFSWPRDNSLRKIIRARNFEASVAETSLPAVFGEGWYAEESDGGSYWRWMSKEGSIRLAERSGPARLTLRFGVPVDALAQPPTVTVIFNGEILESFVATTPEVTRSWRLEGLPDGPDELTIRTSGTVIPAASGRSADTRELGLMVRSVAWAADR